MIVLDATNKSLQVLKNTSVQTGFDGPSNITIRMDIGGTQQHNVGKISGGLVVGTTFTLNRDGSFIRQMPIFTNSSPTGVTQNVQ